MILANVHSECLLVATWSCNHCNCRINTVPLLITHLEVQLSTQVQRSTFNFRASARTFLEYMIWRAPRRTLKDKIAWRARAARARHQVRERDARLRGDSVFAGRSVPVDREPAVEAVGEEYVVGGAREIRGYGAVVGGAGGAAEVRPYSSGGGRGRRQGRAGEVEGVGVGCVRLSAGRRGSRRRRAQRQGGCRDVVHGVEDRRRPLSPLGCRRPHIQSTSG